MTARFLSILAAALLLVSPNLWAQSQQADPPGRVGRLSAIDGSVQQRTPDDNDWVQADLNYPVTTGFAIAPQENGRAEIQVGATALRVGPLSELDVTSLTDRETSLTLAQGELNLRVGQLSAGERIEIVTPRGVMEILAAGQYHLDAGTTDGPTRFEVFNGRAQVQRDGGNTDIANGQVALINPDGTLATTSAQPDPLDQWAFDRDRGPAPRRRTANAPPPPSAGAPDISPEITGGADLAAYGNWGNDSQYGSIWYPSDVPSGWAPYTDGHWSWVSPWGWTWIDDEPWGFAPFHYGRWAYTGIGWGWVPGAYVETPVYAPSLVVFFGGGGSSFYYGGYGPGIGWCPLGPGELFVPSFSASVAFVHNVNVTNVNINNFNITRVNNTIVVNNDPHWGGQVSNFANHRFATVVPANQFGQSQRVRDVAIRNASVTMAAARQPIARDPAVTPPRTAAGVNATANGGAPFNRTNQPPVPQARTAAGVNATANRGAPVNRMNQPPVPQARTATGVRPGQPSDPGTNAPTRTIAGHTLPALPPAHGAQGTAGSNALSHFGAGAGIPAATNAGRGSPSVPPANGSAATAGPNGPGRFGANTRTPTSNAGRNLPPVPSAQTATPSGNRLPQGVNNGASTPAGRTAHGPFGAGRQTTTPSPNLTTGSAGHGLPQLPTTRQSQTQPPPQTHVAQPPTQSTGSSGGHRGFAAPVTPPSQRSVTAPTHNFSPPPQPQRNFPQPSQPPRSAAAPTHNFSPPSQPQRSFSQPSQPQHSVAAPTHVAPPAAPARPVGNAAAPRSAAPHPQAPAPNQKRNDTGG